MQVDFTPEQEAKLSEAAQFKGKPSEQIVQEATLRFLEEEEAEFLVAVDEGIADADAGRYVDSEEVWARVQKLLQE